MTQKRYHIRAGAKTTVGGTVRASSEFCKVNGVPLAREGDPVDCPSCGSQGVIKCVMPRLPEAFDGKQFALSDDLCICGCNPPPKLIADQNFKCQFVTPTSAGLAQDWTVRGSQKPAAPAAAEKAGQTTAASMPASDLRPLRFIDPITKKPHANRPYRLGFENGKVIQGTTDNKGETSPLSREERASLRSW